MHVCVFCIPKRCSVLLFAPVNGNDFENTQMNAQLVRSHSHKERKLAIRKLPKRIAKNIPTSTCSPRAKKIIHTKKFFLQFYLQ